jgi:hypothetical protein
MLITRTNPVGLSKKVQDMQTYLHGQLLKKWNLETTPNVYHCHGLCYRNRRAGGYIAEVYVGNDEYKEVYWDDALHAISFFGVSERFEFEEQSTSDIHLVFFVNVAKLKPTIAHRADEEIRADVESVFQGGAFGFELEDTELWLENVLREYQASLISQDALGNEKLKYVDMHPVHCFRINLKAFFDIGSNC